MSGWDRLTRVVAPAVPALALADAKAHLRVDTSSEDALIGALVADAVARVDGPRGIGLCLITQTWRLTLDRFDRFIPLPLGPNAAVESVKYVDGAGVVQTVDPGDYQVAAGLDPAVLSPTYGTCWPSPRSEPGCVRIEFTAGFGAAPGDVPADLVGALKLIVGELYKNREGGGTPPAAEAVFDRYRVLPVA